MKILFTVTYDLRRNASRNIRNISLIKALHDNGNDIFVIMENSNKNIDYELECILQRNASICTKKKNVAEVDSKIIKKKENKIKIRVFSKISSIYASVFTIDPSVLKIANIMRSTELPDKIDMIISSSDPNSSHILGKKLKQIYKDAYWIQYWGDVMSEDIQYNRVKHYFSRITEKKILNQADYIVYTNPIVSEYMKKENPDLYMRIKWIPTPFEVRKYPQKEINYKNLKIGYFGSYGKKQRSIKNFCLASNELEMNMIVCGRGECELPEGIEVKRRINTAQLEEEEKKCDIIVIPENHYIQLSNGKRGCLQVPGKLYHYANSNYYIVVACEGELLKEYYSKYNRYIFCKNSVEEIEEALKEIRSGLHKDTIHFVTEFQSDSIVNTFLTFLHSKEDKQ